MSDDELKRLFEEFRRENNATHAETQQRLGSLDKKVDYTAADLRQHFDVTAEKMRDQTQLLVEAVTGMREELRQMATNLDAKIERTAAETQAMIKFSHAELDRRMHALEERHRALEDALDNLQARVERLESSSSTH